MALFWILSSAVKVVNESSPCRPCRGCFWVTECPQLKTAQPKLQICVHHGHHHGHGHHHHHHHPHPHRHRFCHGRSLAWHWNHWGPPPTTPLPWRNSAHNYRRLWLQLVKNAVPPSRQTAVHGPGKLLPSGCLDPNETGETRWKPSQQRLCLLGGCEIQGLLIQLFQLLSECPHLGVAIAIMLTIINPVINIHKPS